VIDLKSHAYALRAASCLLGLSLILTVTPHSTMAATMVPAPDPTQGDGGVSTFYTWEKAIPERPGKLLRTEPLPQALALSEAAQQVRILYTSRDGVGDHDAVVVSGVLYVPAGTPPAHGWPLVAWAHGTTGLADTCAPSWIPHNDSNTRYLNAWLHAGFAVVATDYQGLGTPGPHPYINMRVLAYSVLDSIRAVPRSRYKVSPETILVGFSQGAGAAAAAAGYAPHYAPELKIHGTVVNGVPNLSAESMKSGTTAAGAEVGVLPYIAMQARQIHPDLRPEDIFTPSGEKLYQEAIHTCLADMRQLVSRSGLTHDTALKPGMLKVLFDTDMTYKMYPSLKLTHPIFVATGDVDKAVDTQTQLALDKQLCDAGTTVEAHLYVGADHSGTLNAAAADEIVFAHKVLEGKTVTPICIPQPQ